MLVLWSYSFIAPLPTPYSVGSLLFFLCLSPYVSLPFKLFFNTHRHTFTQPPECTSSGSVHHLIHTAHLLPVTSSAVQFPPIPASSFVYQALPGASEGSAAVGSKRTHAHVVGCLPPPAPLFPFLGT